MKKITISKQVTPRDSRAVELYLRDLKRFPLLTADEEVELARKIHAGDERALERMVNCNLRFVVTVAKCYQGLGLELGDLISAGNIGLISAARRFDETIGTKFSTYAVCWIRQSILQSLAKEGRAVRLPAHQQELLSKVNRELVSLEQELQRIPTIDEVADRLGETLESLNRVLLPGQRLLSLDVPLQDDSDSTRADTLADPSAHTADERLLSDSLHSDIATVLSILPDNERTILLLSFGIGTPHPASLHEIALRMDLSVERVRQLYNKALLRLQNSSVKELLREYL